MRIEDSTKGPRNKEYSASKLKPLIHLLNAKTAVTQKSQTELMQIYADLLVKNTAKIPGDIDPRNDRRFIWDKLGAHDVTYLKGTCLPLYVDPSYSRERQRSYIIK